MEVEVEGTLGAAEAADIDDAAFDGGGGQVLVGDARRNLIDDEIDALAAGRVADGFRPGGIAAVDGEIGAEFLKPRAARPIGRAADDKSRAFELCNLQAHEPDARACALDEHTFAGSKPPVGD